MKKPKPKMHLTEVVRRSLRRSYRARWPFETRHLTDEQVNGSVGCYIADLVKSLKRYNKSKT